MKFEQKHFLAIFLMVLIFSVLGLLNLSRRPGLPFPFETENEQVVLIPSPGERGFELSAKTRLISIDGFRVKNREQLFAVVERKKIGETLKVQLEGGRELKVQLIARNNFWYLLWIPGIDYQDMSFVCGDDSCLIVSQASIREPNTSRNLRIHSGCAGQAGAVTRLPSTLALEKVSLLAIQVAPAFSTSGFTAG